DDFGDVSVVTATLTGEDFETRELRSFARYIQDQLYAIPGTRSVDIMGLVPEQIAISWDTARLDALGLSPEQVTATLQGQNSLGLGSVEDLSTTQTRIQVTGEFTDVEALLAAQIRSPIGGGLYPLSAVAKVEREEVHPAPRRAYRNGKPAVVIAVSMMPGVRVLDYGPLVAERIDTLQATLPVGLELKVDSYQPIPVERAISNVTVSVLQTLGIVLLIVVIILGVRGGLIVGAIVPIVMLMTLAIMGLTEMSLERMSMATLVIALGLLVDNGIVVAEDFKRRLEDGVSRLDALQQCGEELTLPLLSSTATTVLVFLPLMLAEHASGEYTRSISLVILISLTTSWVMAMTVTPVLCYHFLPDPSPDQQEMGGVFGWMAYHYARLLRLTLRLRWVFALAMVGLLMVAGYGMSKVPKRFFPASDRPEILIYLDLPPSATAHATAEALEQTFQIIDRVGGEAVVDHVGYVGFGGPRFALSLTPIDPTPNRAFAVVRVTHREVIDSTVSTIRRALHAEMPEIRADVGAMFLGPSDSAILQIQVRGPDVEVLEATREKLLNLLLSDPDVVYVRDDWEGRVRRANIELDAHRVARAGLTSEAVAQAVATHLKGRPIMVLREHEQRIPVLVRGTDRRANDTTALEQIPIARGPGMTPVPLYAVADVTPTNELARIARKDLQRAITFDVRNVRLSAEEFALTLDAPLAKLRAELPLGHTIGFDGVVEESAEGQAALAVNVPLCVALMVLLLIWQFNSFRRPLIIFGTIPLIIIGAALGLHMTGSSFGFMVILGLYGLVGIIINNAIVLIDRIDIERHLHDDPIEAVVAASARRLRPILMATTTTVLGLLPLIIANDPLFYGLAVVMAFGLVVGTVLTLGVVPVAYTILFRLSTPSTPVA
ncbi:MAG: efflux RND transporter permease subunit, partial [Myxococcota bacterium]